MNRLMEIGFQHVGKWSLKNNALALELDRMGAQRKVLYAFITEQSVLYVGKTTGTLEARMGGYLRPHPTQRTNVRNNQALIQLLQRKKTVEIYAWADPGLHRVGQFHLNYAAGLEDSIIQTLAPPWNGARTTPERIPSRANVDTVPSPTTSASVPDQSARLKNDSEEASPAEVKALEEGGILNVSPTFKIKLGNTYFNRGFFNVPVKYSGLFPEHGNGISIYCGDARILVRAIVDRNANQGNGTPRIYGKSPLIGWFRQNCQLNDDVTVRVINRNEIEIR